MNTKKYRVTLTDEERQSLAALTTKGKTAARSITRARILLQGDTTRAGMHVPLIASWPGKVPAGKANGDLIDSTDFLPTVCDAAGVAVPADLKFDGKSFWPQLRGDKGTPRQWVYCWFSRNGGDRGAREFAATARFKLYRTGELFDTEADPDEKAPLREPVPAGAAEDRKLLQGALDGFKGARPEALRKKPAKE